MSYSIELDGMWDEATKLFVGLDQRVASAIKTAMMQEAQDLRKRIVMQFSRQAPISGQWPPLAKTTLSARKSQGFGGTKILIRSADLRNSITIVKQGGYTIFVGVPRSSAKASGGAQHKSQGKKTGKKAGSFKAISLEALQKKQITLVNLGAVHEFGATIRIRVTRKMQMFLFGVLMKGKGGGGGGGGKFKLGATITIRIPPRPFIGPAVDGYDFELAIAVKFSILMQGDLGKAGK